MKVLGRQVHCGGGARWVRLAVGLLLLVAAGLKAYDLATGPVLGDGLLQSRWFSIGVVEFELLLGLWLLSGVYPARAWAVSLGCFVCFGCVALYKALSGEPSCGCFGRVEVNPWVTLGMDVLVVALLLRWRPAGIREPLGSRPIPRVRRIAVFALCFAASGAFSLAIGSYENAGAMASRAEAVVLLDPEEFVGNRFPLLKDLEVPVNLGVGEWVVVFYRRDCSKCQRAIEQALQFHLPLSRRSARVAVIEISPSSKPHETLAVRQDMCIWGRLRDTAGWTVATPVEMVLSQGRVTCVTHI